MNYVITYDIGTTEIKTCLYIINEKIELIDAVHESYDIYMPKANFVEQDENEWWLAMCSTTKKILKNTGINPENIKGISFCSQMLGVVIVDKNENAIRRPINYLDSRGKEQFQKYMAKGIKIDGCNVFKILKNLYINNGAPVSIKDTLWKYKWIEQNEPEKFKKIYKWIDVKDYFIARCTNKVVTTADSAYLTFLYDRKKKKWSKSLCKMYGVNFEHLPKIVKSTDIVGGLTINAANDLGLVPDIPVIAGGGDASLICIGAGCSNIGKTNVYFGTSGWVSTTIDKNIIDLNSLIASLVGAEDNKYNYMAQMETAGKCFEWIKNNILINDFENSGEFISYESVEEYIRNVPNGSNGLMFTPWLNGERCPFSDVNARGMFLNIGLNTTKREMVKAVLESICYHYRWMMECIEKRIEIGNSIVFCGGGAKSNCIAQILANVTGKIVEIPEDPVNVGTIGAASLIAVALGIIPNIKTTSQFVNIKTKVYPEQNTKLIYDKYFEAYIKIYKANKKIYFKLNEN